MEKLLILASFLIIPLFECNCQNDWKPGYIINNSNDTIYGSIDYRNSKSNSKQCIFKKDGSSEATIYAPDNILGYRFANGKFFISKTVSIADTTRNVFLEFIVNGKADLFHYKDDNDYYFLEKDGEIYSLLNTIKKTEIDGIEYQQEKKEFIGVLNTVMQDAEDMGQDISNSSFSTKSLIKLTKKYHEKVCDDEQCIVYERKEKVQFKWGLHFGEAINTINFSDKYVSNYGISSFIGFRLNIVNPIEWSENIGFTADLTLHRFSKYELHEINYDYFTNNYNAIIEYENQRYDYVDGTKFNVDLKALALKIPVVVTYTFSRGNLNPYIGLGISNTFFLSQNEELNYLDFKEYFGHSIPPYLILGYVGRAGFEKELKNQHSIYCDINLDYSQNSQTGSYIFTNKMYFLTIGYLF